MSSGFEMNYEIDGRKVSQEEWLRSLKKEATEEAMSSVVEEIEAEVARLRCPVHGEHPKVVTAKIEGNRLTTEISACCDEMLEKAEKAAAGEV